MNRMLPKRRTRPKMGLRVSDRVRSDGHLKWLRGCKCAIDTSLCSSRIEAAHVRRGTDGATGVKPGDCWAIPLCDIHHREQHQCGEETFERRYGIDMREIARACWDNSPHRLAWERKHDGQ